MVVAPPRLGGSMKDRSPKSPQTAGGNSARARMPRALRGPQSDARKRCVLATTRICVLVHRWPCWRRPRSARKHRTPPRRCDTAAVCQEPARLAQGDVAGSPAKEGLLHLLVSERRVEGSPLHHPPGTSVPTGTRSAAGHRGKRQRWVGRGTGHISEAVRSFDSVTGVSSPHRHATAPRIRRGGSASDSGG
jgi:hypothetical protein